MPADLVQKRVAKPKPLQIVSIFLQMARWINANGWQLLNAVNGCFIGGALNDACVLLVIMVDGELFG